MQLISPSVTKIPIRNSHHHLFFLFFLYQDTAGSERYEAMSRIYYRGAKAAVLCYGKKYRPDCTTIQSIWAVCLQLKIPFL